MKAMKQNPVVVIEQLEYELNNLYGSEFIEDLQKVCGMKSMRDVFGEGATTKAKQVEYAAMLRGAWYASSQVYNIKKKSN